MNKKELIEAVAKAAGLTNADGKRAVDAFIDTVTKNVKKGKRVAISGLGTFEKVKRKARTGVNPATGEKIKIKAKNAPKFKASKPFKDLVAGAAK